MRVGLTSLLWLHQRKREHTSAWKLVSRDHFLLINNGLFEYILWCPLEEEIVIDKTTFPFHFWKWLRRITQRVRKNIQTTPKRGMFGDHSSCVSIFFRVSECDLANLVDHLGKQIQPKNKRVTHRSLRPHQRKPTI